MIITVRSPIARRRAKRSLMPSLTMSLRWMTPSTRRVFGHHQRSTAALRDPFDDLVEFGGTSPPLSRTNLTDLIGRALADPAPVDVNAAHAGLRGERDELGVLFGQFAAADVELALGQDHDRAAFRGFVGERSQLRGVGQFFDRARRARG